MFNIDTDHSLIDTGVWGRFNDGQFLIAHISNLKFQRALARLQQSHRKKIEAGTLDPKIGRELTCQAMSEAILLDWKNVMSGGQEVPHSIELAATLLMKDPEFRDFVTEFSVNIANYRAEEVENLGKP